MSAKILLIDIETAPSKVYTFTLWKPQIGLQQIIEDGYMLSYTAKWLDNDKIYADSIYNYKSFFRKNPKSDLKIGQSVWKLIHEADIVIAHNGDDFDLKWLNTVFQKHDMRPPSSYKSIDTLKVARNNYRFLSNKLDFVSKTLGLGEKIKTEGFPLWIKCMEGDPEAWQKMMEYNKQDLLLLEQVYLKVRPYIKNHPNVALYSDIKDRQCNVCGSTNAIIDGHARLTAGIYLRYQCKDCGKYFRGNQNLIDKDKRKNLSLNIL